MSRIPPARPPARVFGITSRIRPLGQAAPAPSQTVRIPIGPRPTPADCQACPWYHPMPGTAWEGRCAYPSGRVVCTSSASRLHPWSRMPVCPSRVAGGLG